MDWGVCTTAKASVAHLLAFVAWHKHLGASRIWVHLDDADAVTANILNQVNGVEAVLCDDAYWSERGERPQAQELRQSYNIQRIYTLCDLPFLAHLDVDEFLLPARAISDILENDDSDQPFIQCRPAEALHDSSLEDDIFTARMFELPFHNQLAASAKTAVYGEFAPLLPSGMLSHKVGKSLFRTGVDGLIPRLHAASFGPDTPPIAMPKSHEIVVLHFHAQDRKDWGDAVYHRATKGAYRFNEPLAAFLSTAPPEDIERFYLATQTATPELVRALEYEGLLIEADLRLKEKVAQLF